MTTDGLARDFGELAKLLISEKSSNCQKEGLKYNTANILKTIGCVPIFVPPGDWEITAWLFEAILRLDLHTLDGQ
jgi:hypothetical protein